MVKVLDGEIVRRGDDLGAAFVGKLVPHTAELVDDQTHELLGRPQDRLQFVDHGTDFLELGDDLVALEGGEALQAHVEHRLRLDVAHREALHHELLGRLRVLGATDELDQLVSHG